MSTKVTINLAKHNDGSHYLNYHYNMHIDKRIVQFDIRAFAPKTISDKLSKAHLKKHTYDSLCRASMEIMMPVLPKVAKEVMSFLKKNPKKGETEKGMDPGFSFDNPTHFYVVK